MRQKNATHKGFLQIAVAWIVGLACAGVLLSMLTEELYTAIDKEMTQRSIAAAKAMEWAKEVGR